MLRIDFLDSDHCMVIAVGIGMRRAGQIALTKVTALSITRRLALALSPMKSVSADGLLHARKSRAL
jgi:hypothetical protein